MSFLISRQLALKTFASRTSTAITSRGFSVSLPTYLKESDRHTDREALAEKNEEHKQDQLKKQKEGKGHWKPELASDSEEAVTADRQHQGESPQEMMEKTAKHAEEKHKAGTSQHDGFVKGGN